jgi:membrane protein implicated in regulation of membrane protease activity
MQRNTAGGRLGTACQPLKEEFMNISPSLLWFLAGVVFLVAELMIPGFILIFFTAGCWIAGLAIWLFNISLTTQILVFIISSLILLFCLRKYFLKTFKGTTRENIDDNYSDAKIGKSATVTKAIAPHAPGEIKVMGSFWRAVADTEIAEGVSVIIEKQEPGDSLTFKVKLPEGEST